MAKRTELVRNAERALALRKADAAEAGATLGADISTPTAFLEEWWALYGDGRSLISSTQRLLLMLQVLQDHAAHDDALLAPTVGTARLLGSMVQRYAGVPAFDDALRVVTEEGLIGMSPNQLEALKAVARYVDRCNELNLIEPGSAARVLNERGVPVLARADEPLFTAPAMTAWLGSGEEGVMPPLTAPEQMRFVFLTGSTVIVRAVKEEVEAAARGGAAHIVVFAPDPADLYAALIPVLTKADIQASCKTRVMFLRTWLGGALHAVRELLKEGADWRMQATDFAYSPFSGITPWDAQQFNTRMRGDSLMQPDHARAWLDEASPTYASFARVAEEPSPDAVEALKDALKGKVLIPARDRQRETAALDALISLIEGADEVSAEVLLQVLDALSVPLAQESAFEGEPRATVTFLPMSTMDSLAPESVDAIIFADMTKDAFSVPSAKPATQGILEKLGIHDERDRHEEYRAAFATAVQAARASVSCIVPLRTFGGSQKYPSFIYDEFVEALAQGDTFEADAEGLFLVPERFRGTFRVMDELDVVQGFGQTFTEPQRELELPVPEQGLLHTIKMPDLMWMSDVKPGLAVLSASQLALYVQCPYHWFISNKIRVSELDETLDALHKGTFAHEVFRRTFEALADEGIQRVTAQNLDAVQDTAHRTFESLRQQQLHKDPGDRCVAANVQDELQMETLERQIIQALTFMQHLPEGFSSAQGELRLKPKDGVEYAGAVINGSVDRVDVSADGRFAVLDYKGSVAGHEAGCAEEDLDGLPAKIQTLVYAQSVGRLPEFANMACVGAMYLGYRASKAEDFSAGSFDIGRYDMRPLTKGTKSVVHAGFAEFLDHVEELLRADVAHMMEGDIKPDPLPGACAFCEMTFCAMRMAS